MSTFASLPQPTIDVRWPWPDTAHVVLAGEHDLESVPDLAQALTRALVGCRHLIVDLSATEFIDSSTISALVHAKRAADDGGRRFTLVLGSTPIVERVLEITGLLPTLNRVKTLEQALARQEP